MILITATCYVMMLAEWQRLGLRVCNKDIELGLTFGETLIEFCVQFFCLPVFINVPHRIKTEMDVA